MPFANFKNPFQSSAAVPEIYRKHPATRKLFRIDGSYVRQAEDPVTLWAIDILVREYGVPLEAMQLELNADFSEGTHTAGRRYLGRVDVVIYDDRYADAVGNLDVAFIMLEAMEPRIRYESDGDEQSWKGHYTRLGSYMAASNSARYAILTNGEHTAIYRRDLEYPRNLEPIGNLLRYESAREKAKQWEQNILKRKFGDTLGVRLAFNEGDMLMFKPHTTVEIVRRLQPWSLR